jgi:16S rRNA (guanine527-N7)-methyltransferase
MSKDRELLRQGIAELGFRITEDQLDEFITYLQELMKWNKAHNLTGLKTRRDIIIKHFLDSLLFAKVLPEDVCSVVDVGSGAGFPGLPLSILFPDLRVLLLEPTKKKAIFLRHIVHLLGLKETEVIDKRVEDISGVQVDAALTRALFSITEFLDKTKQVISTPGYVILSKGPSIHKELKNMVTDDVSIVDCKLPFLDISRHLVIIKITGKEG